MHFWITWHSACHLLVPQSERCEVTHAEKLSNNHKGGLWRLNKKVNKRKIEIYINTEEVLNLSRYLRYLKVKLQVVLYYMKIFSKSKEAQNLSVAWVDHDLQSCRLKWCDMAPNSAISQLCLSSDWVTQFSILRWSLLLQPKRNSAFYQGKWDFKCVCGLKSLQW